VAVANALRARLLLLSQEENTDADGTGERINVDF
jgi:hypothetical protein